MDTRAVPQEVNATLDGHSKAVYARDEAGRIVAVPCSGWQAEEIVTLQAVDLFRGRAEAARQRARAGQASPLEYWMYARRMDLATFSQSCGVWQWRIRRHFDARRFARLDDALRARYAEALGISAEQLGSVP